LSERRERRSGAVDTAEHNDLLMAQYWCGRRRPCDRARHRRDLSPALSGGVAVGVGEVFASAWCCRTRLRTNAADQKERLILNRRDRKHSFRPRPRLQFLPFELLGRQVESPERLERGGGARRLDAAGHVHCLTEESTAQEGARPWQVWQRCDMD